MPPVPFVLRLLKVFDLCGHKVQLVCQIRKTAFLRSYAYAWYGYGQGHGSVGRRVWSRGCTVRYSGSELRSRDKMIRIQCRVQIHGIVPQSLCAERTRKLVSHDMREVCGIGR